MNQTAEHDYDESWDKWEDMIIYSPAPRHRRRIARSLLKKYAPQLEQLHDIGCGNGAFLQDVRALFPKATLTGSDISERITERNKKRFPEMNFETLDLRDGPREREAYDAITCMEVLEHVDDLPSALSTISAMLRPKGVLILSVPGGPIRPIDKMMGHVEHFPTAARFAEEHFEIIHSIRWGLPFFNIYKVLINLSPEKMNDSFAASSYTPLQKLLAQLVYISFFFNLPFGGEQLFAVLRKREAES